jgi:hypothetical protein
MRTVSLLVNGGGCLKMAVKRPLEIVLSERADLAEGSPRKASLGQSKIVSKRKGEV